MLAAKVEDLADVSEGLEVDAGQRGAAAGLDLEDRLADLAGELVDLVDLVGELAGEVALDRGVGQTAAAAEAGVDRLGGAAQLSGDLADRPALTAEVPGSETLLARDRAAASHGSAGLLDLLAARRLVVEAERRLDRARTGPEDLAGGLGGDGQQAPGVPGRAAQAPGDLVGLQARAPAGGGDQGGQSDVSAIRAHLYLTARFWTQDDVLAYTRV